MRIALFSDSFLPVVDGVGRVVVRYAEMLAGRGHEVYVICPQADTGYRGGLPYEIVDYVGTSLPPTPQYRAGVALLDTNYRSRMRMLDFDIIHAHSPGTTGLEAVRQAVSRQIPLVGTFHSKYYDDVRQVTHSDALATVGARYVAEFYHRCEEVWTVSLNAAETLKTYGYHGPLRIMPNGTDRTEIREEDERAARAAFGLPDRPILLYVGQLNFKKNLRLVLVSAAMAKNAGYDFELVLAGQGPDRAALEELGTSLGLSERCSFRGISATQASCGACTGPRGCSCSRRCTIRRGWWCRRRLSWRRLRSPWPVRRPRRSSGTAKTAFCAKTTPTAWRGSWKRRFRTPRCAKGWAGTPGRPCRRPGRRSWTARRHATKS